MNKQPQKKQTSADAYYAKANDIARLIDVLQMELRKHQEDKFALRRGWGLVEDLDKVRQDLIQTVSFISGIEPEQIEEFLAE
jgi:hypothetical protein